MMRRQALVLIFLLSSIAGYGTHIRGGQIRVVSTNALTCRIELRLLINTLSEVKAGEGTFDFGDGTTVTTPTHESVAVPGLQDVGVAVYTFDHEYATIGAY